MKILVTSHGGLAEGILSSYKMLAGTNDHIIYLTLTDSDTGQYKEKLADVVKANDQILILCDIKGGTPFNESYRLFLQDSDNIRVISGLNLGMLLEIGLAESSGNSNLNELAKLAKQAAVESIDIATSDEGTDSDDIEF